MKLSLVALCFLLSACANLTPSSNLPPSSESTSRNPDSALATDVKDMQTILRCAPIPGGISSFNVGKSGNQVYIYSPSNHFVDEIHDQPNIGFATENGIAKGYVKSDTLLTGTFKLIRKNEQMLNEEWALSFSKPGISIRDTGSTSIPFYDVRIMVQNPEDGPSPVLMQLGSNRIRTHVCCPAAYFMKKIDGYMTCQKTP